MGPTLHDRRGLLEHVAHLLDEAHHLSPSPSGHLAAFIEIQEEEAVLGVRTFDEHPCDVLGPRDVPDSWWALVLSSPGRAHFLDEPDRPSEPITSTFARSRDGDELSLLRRGDALEALPERAEGRIPDLLRALLPAPARARP